MKLALAAHAKLNLELRVLDRLPDGRHAVRTVLQAISAHDLLSAEPAPQTELVGGLPNDLVLAAARALERRAGRPLPARFVLHKRLPAGAGLGGGSSDAAAALRLLARLYEIRLDLYPVAQELGADVAFFLRGGSQLGTGRGDLLSPLPASAGCYVLAWPGYEVSTAAVYHAFDELGGDGANQLQRAAEGVEPRLVEFARRLGTGWHMTGSGSAYFLPLASPERASHELERVAAIAPWRTLAWPVGGWD
ncbi:MAG: 4-(cytidine 5'-diphospho)-2-C-methyl-D-erythritol kinase [Candidatus Dormibacteraceae bacterium]